MPASNTKMRLAKAALVVALLGLLSKLFGFIREVTLAKYFGAAAATDAYLIALIIPGFMVGALINAITVTFIPIFAEYKAKEGDQAAFRLANNTINLLLSISVGIGLVGYWLAPQIVRFLAPGFHGAQAQTAVILTRIMFPSVLALSLNGIATAILQSHQRYWVPALIGLPYNFILITAIILSSKWYGIYGVAVGTALAIFSQALVQVPALYQVGFRYRPVLDVKEKGLQKIWFLIWPVLFGIASSQINTIIDRWLASTLREGSISALNYAFRLVSLPLNLLVSAVNSVTYPVFARLAAGNQREELGNTYLRTAELMIFVFIPLAAGMMVLREPFVRAAFQRGAFSAGATATTATALMFYALGLVAYALNDLSARVFFSLQDTRTPVLVSLLTVALNVSLNLALIRPMAHGGLALATSMASLSGTVAYIWLLHRKYGVKGVKRLFTVFGVVLAASALMGLAVEVVYRHMPGAWITGGFVREVAVLLALAILGAGVYLAAILASRLPEGREMLQMVKNLLRRKNTSASEISQEVEHP